MKNKKFTIITTELLLLICYIFSTIEKILIAQENHSLFFELSQFKGWQCFLAVIASILLCIFAIKGIKDNKLYLLLFVQSIITFLAYGRILLMILMSI